MTRATKLVLALILVSIGACGGDDGSTEATPISPVAPPTAVSDAQQQAEGSRATSTPVTAGRPETTQPPGLVEETSPAVGTDRSCTPGEAPGFVAGWPVHEATYGEFSLSYPPEWIDLEDAVTGPISDLVDAVTLLEAGYVATSWTQMDLLVKAEGAPSLMVGRVPGVSLGMEKVSGRARDQWLESSDVEEVLDDELSVCLGGTRASGFSVKRASLVLDPSSGEVLSGTDALYESRLYAVRDGVLFEIAYVVPSEDELTMLDWVAASWSWSDVSPDYVVGRPFEMVGTAVEIDPDASAADPGWFTSAIPAGVSHVHVVYRLTAGIEGNVHVTWSFRGEPVFRDQMWIPSGRWAYNTLTYTAALPEGEYEVELRYEGSPQTEVLGFTIG